MGCTPRRRTYALAACWCFARKGAVRGSQRGACSAHTASRRSRRQLRRSGVSFPAWRIAARLRGFGTTIFAEMSALAAEHRRGQPRPGLPRHRRARRGARGGGRGDRAGRNQYPPGPGVPELRAGDRRAPAALLRPRARPRRARSSSPPAPPRRSPRRVLGAVRARATRSSTFEPYYDSYAAAIAMAGARAPCRSRCARRTSRSTSTRCARRSRRAPGCVLLNTPHNPTGKVFTRAELEPIARSAVEHDVSRSPTRSTSTWSSTGEHVPLATLPGMRERTLTISSRRQDVLVHRLEGRLGDAARAELVAAVRTAKQFLTYVGGAPFQPAVAAVALRLDDAGTRRCAPCCAAKRDLPRAPGSRRGLRGVRAAGHLLRDADVAPLGDDDALAFCRELPARARRRRGPDRRCSTTTSRPAGPLVRFAFCKRDEVLDEAVGAAGREPPIAGLLRPSGRAAPARHESDTSSHTNAQAVRSITGARVANGEAIAPRVDGACSRSAPRKIGKPLS